MDSSFQKYQVCTGVCTAEERDFLIRNGFMTQDEEGQYHERSTIVDSFAELTDEEDDDDEPSKEEVEKDPAENLRLVQNDQHQKDEFEGKGPGTDEFDMEEIDELISFSDKSDRLPPLELPEVEEIKSADVSELTNENIEQISLLSGTSIKEPNESLFIENKEDVAIDITKELVAVELPDDPAGIVSQVQPAVVVVADKSIIDEELIIAAVPGIDDMSPANVIEEDAMSSNNNTTDSFADISLDEISDASFNLFSDVSDEAMDAKPVFDESFKTCGSAASTASYRSCKGDKGESAKSPDDLDDTLTTMTKILAMADEQEANELKAAKDNCNIPNQEEEAAGESFRAMFSTPMKTSEDTAGESFRTMFKTPMKTPQDAAGETFRTMFKTPMKTPQDSAGESFRAMFKTPVETPKDYPNENEANDNIEKGFKSEASGFQAHDLPSSPSIFATPRGPAPVRRSKRISLNSPQKGIEKTAVGTPPPGLQCSPKQKSPSSPALRGNVFKPPTMDRVGKPSPKPAVQSQRLVSILDSPATRSNKIPTIPVKKVNSPSSRLQKTPEKKLTVSGQPITSPVANYIYSLPPPTQIKRMAPPPIYVPNQVQKTPPKMKSEPKEVDPADRMTKIPKPKSSLPLRHLGTLTESGDNVRKGRETLFAGSMVKNFTPTHYVGSDGVRPVANTVGDPTRPPRPPARIADQGITPVSHRHLGKRDSKNVSMVTETNVERKYCPESLSDPEEYEDAYDTTMYDTAYDTTVYDTSYDTTMYDTSYDTTF